MPGSEMSLLIVVDGHNFVNDVGRYFTKHVTPLGADSELLHPYIRDWFDIDRLVQTSLDLQIQPWRDLGIVVFRSRKAVGEGIYKMQGEHALGFWARQGGNPNTSTVLVDVDGAPSGKDVGMDTAIVVYLFETSARWDAVALFSNDSDFVPAVWSLRRQGKRVFCSSHTGDRGTPLVQACQNFYPWDTLFLKADWDMFRVVQPGGPLDRFVQRPDVSGLQPKIAIEGDCLRIRAGTSQFGGNQQNALNGVLQGYDLWAAETRGELQLYAADRRTPAQRFNFGDALRDGLARNLALQTETVWFGFLAD